MSTEYQKALGRKIAFQRKRRGLSQKEFAGLLDWSEAWVSQVERGVRRIDRMTVLEKVAEVLDVPVIDPSGLSAERQTRFQVDVARAYAQRRQVG